MTESGRDRAPEEADGTVSRSVFIPDFTPGVRQIDVRGTTSEPNSLYLTELGGLAVTGMDASTTAAGGLSVLSSSPPISVWLWSDDLAAGSNCLAI